MANDNDNFKLLTVTNWNEAPDGVALQLDLEEDAWEYGAPPPRGVYGLKMFPQKDGTKMGRIDKNDPATTYYMINFEARVISDNEDYNNVPVFGTVSTRVFRGKNISTAAGLLIKAGVKTLPNPITDKKLAQFVEALLKKEVEVKAELDWRGQYKSTNQKTGEDEYISVFNHYEEFPMDPEKGVRKHLVNVATKQGGQTEVRAQLRIVRFFGKGDTLPTFAPAAQSGLVSMPRSAMPQPTAQPVMAPATTMATPQFVTPAQQTLAAPVANDPGEVDLLLD
jgi:hypothetical protein